jgi:large subunit ribosomal protein L7/L12
MNTQEPTQSQDAKNDSVEDLHNRIQNLRYTDVIKLAMQMKASLKAQGFDPDACLTSAPAANADANDAANEVEKSFNLVLAKVGDKKLKIIQEVRVITALGLKEAKDLVDSAPGAVIKSDLDNDKAQELKAKLESLGAEVKLEAV